MAVRPAVQRAAAEARDIGIERLRQLADLGLRHPGDPKGLDQIVDPAGRDPEHVCLGHHLGEGPLGPPARLEQPVREVRPRAELGDPQIDRPQAGVEAPAAVPVAAVGALGAPLAVPGASEPVDLAGHDPVDNVVQQVAQQVRLGLLELLANERDRLHRVLGHRVVLLSGSLSFRGGWHGGSLYAAGLSSAPLVHHIAGREPLFLK